MTKKILVNKLAEAKLRQYKDTYFKQYMIPEDDERWKYKKRNSIVSNCLVIKFEIWQKRLLKRIFYIQQKWYMYEKVASVHEVSRTLAGCDEKLIRYIRAGQNGLTIDLDCHWRDLSKWENVDVNRYNIEVASTQYGFTYKYDQFAIGANDINELLKNTIHKYSGYEYSDYRDYEVFEYLAKYEKHPEVEMLSKMGLHSIVRNMKGLRFSKKGIAILGIDKQDLQLLKALDFMQLIDFRKELAYLKKYSIDTRKRYEAYQKVKELNEYISLSPKAIDYVEKLSHAEKSIYLRDYYSFCRRLGMPFNSNTKYPKNLKKAHDDLANQIKIQNQEIKTKKIIERVIKELHKYRYANEQYLITPANSSNDLIEESRELKHCVRTYVDKYSEGKTNIFLVRDINNVHTPLYTLETSDNEIIQCRGKNNCKPSDDAIEFVNVWAKKNKLVSCFNG